MNGTSAPVSIVAAGIACIAAMASAYLTYAGHNRELDIRLVEIGVSILRADPDKTGVSAARGWAIQVIEENSRVRFSAQDRAELLKRPLSGNFTYADEYDSTYTPPQNRTKAPDLSPPKQP